MRRPRFGLRRHHARVTAALAERSAQCAHTAIFYSLQSRLDYVLSVHLPSQTRRLVAAVDEALREAYAWALGTDILNPEGDFPEQPDPTFMRDRFSLKHSLGGGGFRPTVERIPFLNSLFSALPAISGSTAQAPLWPSLTPMTGAGAPTTRIANRRSSAGRLSGPLS